MEKTRQILALTKNLLIAVRRLSGDGLALSVSLRSPRPGCGSQRLLRCRSHPAGRGPNSSSLFPPLAAVVAVALFSRFSNLLLRSRLYALAERKVLLKRNTIGGAVNRRSPKNAFSEAASIFGLRQLLWGLKGASSPFLVDPARRNRWCFSGSLLARKRELSSVTGTAPASACYPPQNPAASASASSTPARRLGSPSGI